MTLPSGVGKPTARSWLIWSVIDRLICCPTAAPRPSPIGSSTTERVEWISRDRSTEFARGASEGAPQAQQVLDRWHVLKNLREALERLLNRFQEHLAQLPSSSDGQGPARLRQKRTRSEAALS